MYDLSYPYEFEEGRKAWREGRCLTSNPYSPGTDESDSWQQGWEYQNNLE